MHRRRLLLLIFVPLGVLAGIYALLPTRGGSPSPGGDRLRGAAGRYVGGSRYHVDCQLFVRVTGKLVDPETGLGCAGARILTLPERSWADDTETVEFYRGWNAEIGAGKARAAAQGPAWHVTGGHVLLLAADETTADGTFDVVVVVPWSVNFVGDERVSPTQPSPRAAVGALLVEVEGNDPSVIDIAKNCGDWTEHPDDPDKFNVLWATWDLGTVKLTASD